jgi:hypothetical protein
VCVLCVFFAVCPVGAYIECVLKRRIDSSTLRIFKSFHFREAGKKGKNFLHDDSVESLRRIEHLKFKILFNALTSYSEYDASLRHRH